MFNLGNQVVVITGASSGVGKAIALNLARQGARVCLVGRNLMNLEAIAASVHMAASQTKVYLADLTVDEDIQKLKTYIQQDFGCIDILIHSAGVISMGKLEDASITDFDWQYRINVRAPYLLTQALLPMLKSRKGQILFINSSAGLKARANVGAYSATKYALKAIAESLREEVNVNGVRVLSIFLGRTATRMQETIHHMECRSYHPELFIQPEDIAAIVLNALTLPRTAEVTDISIRPMLKS